MLNYVRWIACVALLVLASTARAELMIEVTQGVDKPSPVAVVPFGWDEPDVLPEDIAQVVENDLNRSGLFSAVPRGEMLSRPREFKEVFFKDWKLLGVSYLLVGRVSRVPGTSDLQIQYELFDVHSRSRLIGEVIAGGSKELRDLAHYISDKVYESLTGIRGIFSTKVLYVTADRSATSGRYQLQIADVDGARVRRILQSGEPIMSPSWAPDGRRIAYVSFEDGRPGIYIQELATGVRRKVPHFKGLNGAPAWSPDGTRIALVLSRDGNPEIYMMDLVSGEMSRLTRHFGIDTEPFWAPDGKSLVFTSNRGGSPQIYRLDLATRSVERLTFKGKYNARGQITADGRYLVMVHRSKGVFHVGIQDLERGGLQILTKTDLDESPTLAPNGHMVMYATKDRRYRGVLAAVSVDGRIKYNIPARTGDVREPAWSPFLN